jgi:hypothetical protein
MSPPPRNGTALVRNRGVWLSAIGTNLKAQYDAVAPPLPRRLAVLIKQLETEE